MVYTSDRELIKKLSEIDGQFLFLVRGLPGSGKSTFAKKIAATVQAVHLETDEFFMTRTGYKFDADCLFRAHNWCQLNTEKYLYGGRSVIVSNTFTADREMRYYIELSEKYNVRLAVIACKSNYGSVHNVPQESLDRMSARWVDVPGEYIYESKVA